LGYGITFIYKKTIQKPNAREYYEGLIDSSKANTEGTFEFGCDVTPALIRAKVQNLRASYQKCVTWSNQTGQGVKETDGETSFRSERALFIHYSICHTKNVIQCSQIRNESTVNN
jgi:hypothetical protein